MDGLQSWFHGPSSEAVSGLQVQRLNQAQEKCNWAAAVYPG